MSSVGAARLRPESSGLRGTAAGRSVSCRASVARSWVRVRTTLAATVALVALVALVTVALVACVAGCASTMASRGLTTTTLDSLMKAYADAHPGHGDSRLHPVAISPAAIVSAIQKDLDPGREIRLPTYLPPGFALAAPYNGDGSGAAYPNPYAWGGGYSVTYTDGKGFIMVFENSDDDLSQGTWTALAETLDGRPLRLQKGSGIVLVATIDDGSTPFLVSGGGFGGGDLASELVKVAASLGPR